MPASTRQQAEEEERAATAAALEEAQGQAEQAVAAEQSAHDALVAEWAAREEADKAREALEGDKTVTSVELVMAGEGRLKFPPLLCIISFAHVKGGTSARISSMTSSQTGISPEREGRDEEPGWASGRVCDWTMNSWVYGSTSLVSRVSPSCASGCDLSS